mmetsp:Transcript_25203/g.66935  ORF Transcript_25203/g.66935 Transcript_25203/m.66935 type:complete len:245 (-) Transcript_25203:50-784(-)
MDDEVRATKFEHEMSKHVSFIHHSTEKISKIKDSLEKFTQMDSIAKGLISRNQGSLISDIGSIAREYDITFKSLTARADLDLGNFTSEQVELIRNIAAVKMNKESQYPGQSALVNYDDQDIKRFMEVFTPAIAIISAELRRNNFVGQSSQGQIRPSVLTYVRSLVRKESTGSTIQQWDAQTVLNAIEQLESSLRQATESKFSPENQQGEGGQDSFALNTPPRESARATTTSEAKMILRRLIGES